MNKYARELGKLGRGKPKTMTPAAIKQRQDAAKSRKTVKDTDKDSQESLQSCVIASV